MNDNNKIMMFYHVGAGRRTETENMMLTAGLMLFVEHGPVFWRERDRETEASAFRIRQEGEADAVQRLVTRLAVT